MNRFSVLPLIQLRLGQRITSPVSDSLRAESICRFLRAESDDFGSRRMKAHAVFQRDIGDSGDSHVQTKRRQTFDSEGWPKISGDEASRAGFE